MAAQYTDFPDPYMETTKKAQAFNSTAHYYKLAKNAC